MATIAQIRSERKNAARNVAKTINSLQRAVNRAEKWARNLIARKTGVITQEDTARLVTEIRAADRVLDDVLRSAEAMTRVVTTI